MVTLPSGESRGCLSGHGPPSSLTIEFGPLQSSGKLRIILVCSPHFAELEYYIPPLIERIPRTCNEKKKQRKNHQEILRIEDKFGEKCGPLAGDLAVGQMGQLTTWSDLVNKVAYF